MQESELSAALRNMSVATTRAAEGLHNVADVFSKVKVSRTIKLHPSFSAIEVPIWAPIFRRAVRQ